VLHTNVMEESALSISNYFIEIAKIKGSEIKPLRLMKLVYIAHGYILASLDKSLLNPRFDKVEAWKYGPVIPSVYHSFKEYGNNPIKGKTVIFIGEYASDGEIDIKTEEPTLQDKQARKICDFVWKRYSRFTDWEIVDFLHKKQSPWGLVYEEGKNKEIPDLYTKLYFRKIIQALKDWANGQKS